MVELLTSPSNPTLKRIRSLHEKKYRRSEGLFLAEGLRIVAEAVEAGVVPELLVFADESQPQPLVARLIAVTEAAGGEAIATSRAMLHKLTGKDNPQAVLGVFRQRATPLAQLDRSLAPIWIVAQALNDPGNLGTMLRTGDAVGAGGIILLDDSCDPFSVEAVRASMGAVFTQAVVQTSGAAFFDWVRQGPGFVAGGVAADRHRLSRSPLRRADVRADGQRAGRAAARTMRRSATCWSSCRCAARPTA